MPKHIDNVIIPDRKRSIRNIPIPEARRRADRPLGVDSLSVKKSASASRQVEEPSSVPPVRNKVRRFSGKGHWFMALGALVVLFLAVISIFDGATVSYTPRSAEVTFNGETFSAYKTGDSGLLYSVVKLSGDKGVEVSASGEREVSRKASGTIIIYNNASTEAQKLVATTRFESADGKVYRIASDISIPGKKGTAPGSVEAVVYADAPGEAYNAGLSDFTLPGLRGTARYETIYARSKTPMTGGFVGKEKSVSPEALDKAETELKTALGAELMSKAQAEVPEDFILFPSLSSIDFESLPQSPGVESGTVTINMRGNLYGIMFKRSDFSANLSLGKTSVVPSDPVVFDSFESLTFSFVNGTPADLLSLNKIDFKVTGSSLLIWKTDEVALKTALVGKGKNSLLQILQNFPTIEKADSRVRPFWKSNFPSEAGKITVKKLKIK